MCLGNKMKYNGIEYRFTEKEMTAMSKLLSLARTSGDVEIVGLAEIIATALNRSAFEKLNHTADKPPGKLPNSQIEFLH